MATDMERLVVSLEAKMTSYEKTLQKALGQTNRAAGSIESRFAKMNSNVSAKFAGLSSSVTAALGTIGALSVGGVIKGLGDVAASVAAIGDEAKRAGLSTKSFQELKFVAEQNRIGVDSLVDGIKELNLRADEFITTGGGSAAEAFGRLGYSAAELKEKLKDPSALFSEIIGKLGQLDKAAQIRIADEVFGGTGGEKFVQLIAQGEAGIRAQIRAANDLGIVLDEAVIARADEVDRKFKMIASTIGTNVKGAIIDAVDSFERFVDLFRDLDNQRLDSLGMQSADIDRRRLENENEILRLRGGGKPNDGILGTPLGASTSGEMVQQLERENEALAEQGRRINEVLSARDKLRGPSIQIGTPRAIAEDRATRFQAGDQLTFPSTAPTPTAREGGFDPYFGGGSDGATKAGEAAGDSMAVEFIKKFEGFRKGAYWDVNAFRAGYGSDTTTREGGKVERVTAATTVSLADANRDLARRIAEFQAVIKGQIGNDSFLAFSEEQQAALTSIAYNYGKLPAEIVAAIQAGNPGQVGAAIAKLGSDNGGINKSRRTQEAELFLSGTGYRDVIAGADAAVTANARLAESYDSLGQIGLGALRGIAGALSDGKLEAGELLQIVGDILQQLLAMPAIPSAGGGKAGGGAGSVLGQLFSWLFAKDGGQINAADARPGGAPARMATGGRVHGPGGPTDDKVLTLLSNGEHVVRARQARKYRRLLEAINNDSLPRMADGGVVGVPEIRMPSAPPVTSRPAGRVDFTNHIVVEGANGDKHVIGLVEQGVAAGLGQYDKVLNRSFGGRMRRAEMTQL